MAYEEGDLKIFNPDREISKEVTLDIIVRHRDAMKQARTGEVPGVEMNKISDNDRMFNRVRALNLIIAAQREMITISRPVIYFRSINKWKKSHKSEDDQKITPFESFDCDYKRLLEFLELLKACEMDIIEADKSKTLEDDFIVLRELPEGDKWDLTPNFYEMLEELESSYEQIYLLMLTNKIVSAGIEEDEEKTLRELEDEFTNRLVEA